MLVLRGFFKQDANKTSELITVFAVGPKPSFQVCIKNLGLPG